MPIDILEEVHDQQGRLQAIDAQLNRLLVLLEGDELQPGLLARIDNLDTRFQVMERYVERRERDHEFLSGNRRALSIVSFMATIVLSFLHHVLLISDYRHPNNIDSSSALVFGIILQIAIVLLGSYGVFQLTK